MKYQGDALSKFPEQIQQVLEQHQPHGLKISDFRSIVIAGLGGSGIGGHITKTLCADTSPVPIEVISDYELPAYVNGETLVIASSYSGNTEETISMYQQAHQRGAPIVALSTGGHIIEKAQSDHYTYYKAVPGFQPRMALGYSLTRLLLIVEELGLGDFRPALEASVKRLGGNRESFISRAQQIMDQFPRAKEDKYVVVADRLTKPFALRFCQQINENSKQDAFMIELPEANHNVMETHYGKQASNYVLMNGKAHERIGLRFGFLRELLEGEGNHVSYHELDARQLPDMLELSYVLDWYSLLLADAKNLNSEAIPNINALKDYLGKH